jgi:hypothetical protein
VTTAADHGYKPCSVCGTLRRPDRLAGTLGLTLVCGDGCRNPEIDARSQARGDVMVGDEPEEQENKLEVWT